MFGIAKGVATGVNERRGKFAQAEGGTLFLDEIGEMVPALQAKLLRALEGREVQPVGGAPVPIDVRVIAATNSDLARRMQEGQFRRDLYYRVAGYVVQVPALRERREDILDLAEGFLASVALETGGPDPRIGPEARRILVEYPWPGNVRELEHEARRLAYLCAEGREVEPSLLSEHLLHPPGEEKAAPTSLDLEANVEHLERKLIQAALARTGGRRAAAARLLGISRNGLALKMDRLELTGPGGLLS
jgi:DNA-binding NtrC family response regulator